MSIFRDTSTPSMSPFSSKGRAPHLKHGIAVLPMMGMVQCLFVWKRLFPGLRARYGARIFLSRSEREQLLCISHSVRNCLMGPDAVPAVAIASW